MEPKKSSKTSLDKISDFADSFSYFSKITKKLQSAYQEIEKKFEDLNLKLEQTNNQLRQSLIEKDRLSNYLNNILESINSGVLAIKKDGKINLFNRAAEEILGYGSKEVLGKDYLEVFGQGLEIEKTPLHTLNTKRVHLNQEKEVFTKSRKKIPLGFSTSLLTDADGNLLGAVETFFDLSHIKRLEEEITRVKTLAALGEMAATVAHEVRNPLGGISGFADILEKDLGPDDPRQRWVKKIIQGVEILNRLVINLLDYTRVVKLSPCKVDFKKFLDDTLNFFQMDNLSKREDVSIIRNFEKKDLVCKIDPEQFRQVVLNLLRNSVQAMPRGGEIEVSVLSSLSKNQEGEVILKITDPGVGMDKKTKEKLYMPFFTTKEGGTGLGLATVKKIVEAHRGEVQIKSTEGRGTEVQISFPKSLF
ncbi:MAG: hypothetical protein AMJ90_08940 [candidate division Zixibacteria bacterium SM23_73_2]|nr:MAG: hypothetical protein AMJ90_08940 [candidate division Zixibacteria bacterium SM23_73_2]